ERPLGSPAGQHELFDRRRSAGLLAATGDLVAIVEDRGWPRSDWARAMAQVFDHPSRPDIAGGAVVCAVEEAWSRAVCFCDFGRYQPPFAAGPATWITDINVAYRREILAETQEVWADRYHETTLHWALQARGKTFRLSPEPIVEQHRPDLRLGPLLAERFYWGRLFAWTRVRSVGLGRRLLHALTSPLLPFLLFGRQLVMQWRKREQLGPFLASSPRVFLLLCAWCLGEAAGYLGSRP
ncbi:MAG: hypothetical protein KDB53_00180, partial [Planctomycetes bacterium]|nr:hypothetical protein [Planctomycetota bacterium]